MNDTLLDTAVNKLGGTMRWSNAAGGKAEIPIEGHLEVFSFSKQEANDKAFVDKKLRMLGFGEKIENTLG